MDLIMVQKGLKLLKLHLLLLLCSSVKIQSKFSQNSVKIHSKCSQNAAKMQLKQSQNAVKIQSKFSQNSAKIQSKFSQNSAKIQPKFSQSSVKILLGVLIDFKVFSLVSLDLGTLFFYFCCILSLCGPSGLWQWGQNIKQ